MYRPMSAGSPLARLLYVGRQKVALSLTNLTHLMCTDTHYLGTYLGTLKE